MALRTLEERERMLSRIAREAASRDRGRSEELFEKRAAEARAHAETIRRIIIEGVEPVHREMNAE
jgi:hypothetical protein